MPGAQSHDIARIKTVATWMRECDAGNFGLFFGARKDVTLLNARVQPVDAAEASGLLLTGGPDIALEFLQQPVPDPAIIRNPDPERDAWEIASVKDAMRRGKPIFAICKGMQVMNVAMGGTLHLDVPGHDAPETKTANSQPLRFARHAHHRYERVNSSHHQALDVLADDLEVEAWCADDGIIEQVRQRNYPWALGVQYHPERDVLYSGLFHDFFAQLA